MSAPEGTVLPLTAFKNGVIACAPTILGYWCIGFACGAIGIISGFSLSAEMALTVFLYAGERISSFIRFGWPELKRWRL